MALQRGALRAVELEKYGMIGHSRIYQSIKKSPYFRDDHLGQISYESGSKAISPSMMDFKIGLTDLVDSKKIPSKESKILIKIYESIHFSEETF